MKISVEFTLPDSNLQEGWFGKPDELALSLVARLDEFYGDDGGCYFPQDVKVHVGDALESVVRARIVGDLVAQRTRVSSDSRNGSYGAGLTDAVLIARGAPHGTTSAEASCLAASDLAARLALGGTLNDLAERLTCSESDAFVQFLVTHGYAETAATFLSVHAESDDEGDSHWTGGEQS